MTGLLEAVVGKAKKGRNAQERMNLLREALHHLILQEVDRKGGFSKICFLGGTALRVVYGLDRFSEDLDFSTSSTLEKRFDLEPLVRSVETSLRAFGFDGRAEKLDTEQNVQKCFFSFRGLLHDVDRAFRDNQKLAIKFDVDSRPPAGAVETVSPITGERVYKIRHYDLPSLFAGKLHAVLFRVYTKGRDLYDFLWYVGRGTKVNGTLLENAIEQTEDAKVELTDENLREMLIKRFLEIDFEKAKKDVSPFLIDTGALSAFEPPVFEAACRKISLQTRD
ncbi:MAG TPA: nucleotidyl transferase AbiEii/AbiGii toxin family protein [bacterium]|nr:nucleotidyl transferase AbiEii/AbiGii toxin family protein [bacterium]